MMGDSKKKEVGSTVGDPDLESGTPTHTVVKKSKNVNTEENTTNKERMVYLDTTVLPDDFKVSQLFNHLNIHTCGLNKLANDPFDMPFGKVISIQRAIDYAVYPDFPIEYLMLEELSAKKINKFKNHRKSVPNFWAYVGYLVIERISQNHVLSELVLENLPIINAEVITRTSFSGPVTTVIPNRSLSMYVGVVRLVVSAYRTAHSLPAEEKRVLLRETIMSLKSDKNVSVFSGMPFAISDM